MKKLKLNLDELKVESFETSDVNNNSGTVKGNESQPTNCPGFQTCIDPTCYGTTCPLPCINSRTCLDPTEPVTCNGLNSCPGGATCGENTCNHAKYTCGPICWI